MRMQKRFVIAAAALAAVLCQATPARSQSGQVANPVSAFPITVDGQFTGGVSGGALVGEWSDVAPLSFISPGSAGGTLLRTDPGDPRTNSLLYTGIAPDTPGGPVDGLYLMYDYLPRTNPVFAAGEFIADITFPIILPGPNPQRQTITVQFRGGAGGAGPDVLVDLNGDTAPDATAASLGMTGAVGFGPSTLSSLSHLLVELEVPLRIPRDFGTPGGPFPSSGINPDTGLYDPNPAFWGSNIAKDAGDPPASAAIFQILPDGTTIADSTIVAGAPAPEPVSAALVLGAGLMAGAVIRRSRHARR